MSDTYVLRHSLTTRAAVGAGRRGPLPRDPRCVAAGAARWARIVEVEAEVVPSAEWQRGQHDAWYGLGAQEVGGEYAAGFAEGCEFRALKRDVDRAKGVAW